MINPFKSIRFASTKDEDETIGFFIWNDQTQSWGWFPEESHAAEYPEPPLTLDFTPADLEETIP